MITGVNKVNNFDLNDYCEKTSCSKEPRPTCKEAIQLFKSPGIALDLGAGVGRDAAFLAMEGWTVIAVDGEAAIPFFTAKADFILASFNNIHFRSESFDLVNASYALPYAAPEDFGAIWSKITNWLRPGGRFSGQLFGPRDSWNEPGTRGTFHTKEEVEKLLDGFDIEIFEEQDADGPATGGQKHWHVWHLVVYKVQERAPNYDRDAFPR